MREFDAMWARSSTATLGLCLINGYMLDIYRS
jgi:hypothetical protein